jgi:urease accessory protein
MKESSGSAKMTQQLLAQTYQPHPAGPATDSLTLNYEDRFLRRKRLRTDGGQMVLIDLAQVTSLDHGGTLETRDGTVIAIQAAPEPLLQVTGDALPRLAWHIGNRHTPCQIEADRLLIQRDKVIHTMLAHLGAEVVEVVEPFTPEGGAYGHGRTHSHEHSASTHTHPHGSGDNAGHDHAH